MNKSNRKMCEDYKGPRTVFYSICQNFDSLWLAQCKTDNYSLCLNETITFCASNKIKNILKILHNYVRTLGFRRWGYFL